MSNSNIPVNPSGASGAAGDSGSVTDTIKGYVHVAMTKGQEALHLAHEKLNEAAAQAHALASSATSHGPAEHPQQSSTTDAFADVKQFNGDSTQATNVASFPSSNPDHKSANSGL